MNFSIASIKAWFSGLFAKGNRAVVVSLLDHVSVFVDHALPIVKAIDEQLKPAIRTSSQPLIITIETFIGERLNGLELTAARRDAQKLVYLPTADMLVNVALILLARAKPESVPTSLLRLAIELAYSIYKATKDEAAT